MAHFGSMLLCPSLHWFIPLSLPPSLRQSNLSSYLHVFLCPTSILWIFLQIFHEQTIQIKSFVEAGYDKESKDCQRQDYIKYTVPTGVPWQHCSLRGKLFSLTLVGTFFLQSLVGTLFSQSLVETWLQELSS